MGMQTCTTTLEINMVVSQKIGNQRTSGSSNTDLCIFSKDAQSYYEDMYSTMFIAALFVIANPWNNLDASTEDQIKKTWYIYTIEYHAIKNKQTNKQKLMTSWNLHANGWN